MVMDNVKVRMMAYEKMMKGWKECVVWYNKKQNAGIQSGGQDGEIGVQKG